MASLAASALFNVEGMVAVVTGGGTGIGASMTKALISNGAHRVYIIGRRVSSLEEVAQFAPDKIIPLQGDITRKDSLASMAARVKTEVGYVNFLVANSATHGAVADVFSDSTTVAEYAAKHWEVPVEDFTNVFHVNTTGAFYTALAFLELLDAGNKSGNMGLANTSQIVFTSSIGAFLRAMGPGVHLSYAYSASKAAVAHMVKIMATQFAPFDIRANALAPGWFETEMAAPLLSTQRIADAPPERAYPKSFIPMQRAGTEQDIAGVILYLASRAGGYVNGTTMLFDGGRTGILPASY